MNEHKVETDILINQYAHRVAELERRLETLQTHTNEILKINEKWDEEVFEARNKIAELERKLEEANQISKERFDRVEELSEALIEESDMYEKQLTELECKLKEATQAAEEMDRRFEAMSSKFDCQIKHHYKDCEKLIELDAQLKVAKEFIELVSKWEGILDPLRFKAEGVLKQIGGNDA